MIRQGFDPSCILVTGGAGFIGSNFIRWVLETQQRIVVINLDALTYAGNLQNLLDVKDQFGTEDTKRYVFVRGDIRDVELVGRIMTGQAVPQVPAPDTVVHFAAESHVDRSIIGPQDFVETNVQGTVVLLNALRDELDRKAGSRRLIHISTDEVYGSLGPDDPPFTETLPLAPNSPYAATKASSDLLVRAYVNTFQLPAIITRCSNNYGPYQFPEKLIPLMITRALENQPLPIYGDGLNVRDWLHVVDHVEALWTVLSQGVEGQIYNIGGGTEIENVQLVKELLAILRKPESLIRYVPDRPGHDRRYAMSIDRIRTELGWSPTRRLGDGLRGTVEWYMQNRCWWERVLTKAYLAMSTLYLPDE